MELKRNEQKFWRGKTRDISRSRLRAKIEGVLPSKICERSVKFRARTMFAERLSESSRSKMFHVKQSERNLLRNPFAPRVLIRRMP